MYMSLMFFSVVRRHEMSTTLFAGSLEHGRDRSDSGVGGSGSGGGGGGSGGGGGGGGSSGSSGGGGGNGGGTGGFLFDSADLLDAVSAIRSPNRSDFLAVEGDWGMVHVSETVGGATINAPRFFSCE